jgi:hypothetical protein
MVVPETLPMVFKAKANSSRDTSSSIGSGQLLTPENASTLELPQPSSRELLFGMQPICDAIYENKRESQIECARVLTYISMDMNMDYLLYEDSPLKAIIYLVKNESVCEEAKTSAMLTLANMSSNQAKQNVLLDSGIVDVVFQVLTSTNGNYQMISQSKSNLNKNMKPPSSPKSVCLVNSVLYGYTEMKIEAMRIFSALARRHSKRIINELGHTRIKIWLDLIDSYDESDRLAKHASIAKEYIFKETLVS